MPGAVLLVETGRTTFETPGAGASAGRLAVLAGILARALAVFSQELAGAAPVPGSSTGLNLAGSAGAGETGLPDPGKVPDDGGAGLSEAG